MASGNPLPVTIEDIRALVAERDRLKDALERIRLTYYFREPEEMPMLPFRMKEIALYALSGKELSKVVRVLR